MQLASFGVPFFVRSCHIETSEEHPDIPHHVPEDYDDEDDEMTVTSPRSEDPLTILTCGVRTPILSLHHRLAPRKSLVIPGAPRPPNKNPKKNKINK